jgi:hypothetical protein
MNMEDIALLEPHACSMRPGVDGNPIASMSWEDLCFALGCLGDSAPSLVVRAKYGNEAQAARDLLRRLRGAVISMSAHRGWNLAVSDVTRLAQVSLEAYILPPLCSVCGGRREAMIGALRVVCGGCEGSGLVAHSDASLAGKLGVTLDDWRQTWERRVTYVQHTLAGWESEAAKIISSQTPHVVF